MLRGYAILLLITMACAKSVNAPDPDASASVPLLITQASGSSSFALAVLAPEVKNGPLRLAVLKQGSGTSQQHKLIQSGENGRPLAIDLVSDTGEKLEGPTAMLALALPEEQVQRAYVFFDGDDSSTAPRIIMEYRLPLDKLTGTPVHISAGRSFEVPTPGPHTGARLSHPPDTETLVLHLSTSGQESAPQPLILLYDIRPGSELRQPLDIKMPPRP